LTEQKNLSTGLILHDFHPQHLKIAFCQHNNLPHFDRNFPESSDADSGDQVLAQTPHMGDEAEVARSAHSQPESRP